MSCPLSHCNGGSVQMSDLAPDTVIRHSSLAASRHTETHATAVFLGEWRSGKHL